jgi:hypothetical protein
VSFSCLIRFYQYPTSGIEKPLLSMEKVSGKYVTHCFLSKGRKVGKVRGLSTEKMESTKGQPRVAWSGTEKVCTTKLQKSSNCCNWSRICWPYPHPSMLSLCVPGFLDYFTFNALNVTVSHRSMIFGIDW